VEDFERTNDLVTFSMTHGMILLERMENSMGLVGQYPGSLSGVGICHAHILHTSICLMLIGPANRSATPGALEAAEKLLKVPPPLTAIVDNFKWHTEEQSTPGALEAAKKLLTPLPFGFLEH